MSNLRMVQDILYQLKREFGLPMNIVLRTSSVPNLDTGDLDVTLDSVRVNRAVLLPNRLSRQFEYDLAYIASNKNFTYGGTYDQNRRRIVVDRRDLPTDFEIKVGYYLVFDGKRYDVEQVDEAEFRAGYILVAKQEINVPLQNLVQRHIFSTFLPTQTVEVTVE